VSPRGAQISGISDMMPAGYSNCAFRCVNAGSARPFKNNIRKCLQHLTPILVRNFPPESLRRPRATVGRTCNEKFLHHYDKSDSRHKARQRQLQPLRFREIRPSIALYLLPSNKSPPRSQSTNSVCFPLRTKWMQAVAIIVLPLQKDT
jgi:hypothetical protein